MSHEIARDITAHQPISPMAQEVLLGMQVSREHVDTEVAKQRGAIEEDIARVGVLLAMSRPQVMDTDSYAHEEAEAAPPELAGFARYYGGILHSPVLKHGFDSQVLQIFMRRLGPTNHLRRQDGLDAAFELGRSARLLEADFRALPPAEQTPERRYGEALIAEELALLWAPTVPQKAQSSPGTHKGMILNTEDPNVFSAKQVEDISEKDRWKLIGAKLSAEAAALFGAIAESGTASLTQRLEARSRATDMAVRQLNIMAGVSEYGRERKQEFRRMAVELCERDLDLASETWNDSRSRAEVKRGYLYEFLALAKKRYEVITTSPTDTIRAALPREDYTKTTPVRSRNGELINLSVDIVREDCNGGFVEAFQVKAMTEVEYERSLARRLAVTGKNPMVYPAKRGSMLFVSESDDLLAKV